MIIESVNFNYDRKVKTRVTMRFCLGSNGKNTLD